MTGWSGEHTGEADNGKAGPTGGIDTLERVKHLPGILVRYEPAAAISPAPVVFDSPHSGYAYPEDFDHVVPRDMLRRAEGERDTGGLLRAGDLTIDLQRRSVRRGGETIELTATEFDLLAILAREPGRPFSRAQLLELAYDISYAGFDRTVDAHIKNLRRKIEPDPRSPQYILTLYGVGYKFAEDTE